MENTEQITGQTQTSAQVSTPTTTPKDERFASYLALQDKVEKEGSFSTDDSATQKPSEGVKQDDVQVTPTEQKGERKYQNDYHRRISVLTKREKKKDAIINELQARLAKLENASKQPEKELTEDNFATTAEYQRYLAKETAKKEIREEISKREAQAEKLRQTEAETEQFRENWGRRAQATLQPEEIEEYTGFIKAGVDPEEIFESGVLEFMQDSDVGPRMMYHFLRNPELIERLNSLKPTVLAARLMQIENITRQELSKVTPQKHGATVAKNPVLTRAPDPIGQVGAAGTGGGMKSDEELADEYRRKYKR